LVTPPTVEITGPASTVNEIQELLTQPVNLSPAGSPTTVSAPLLIPAQNTVAKPANVQVAIRLDQRGEKRLTGLRLLPPARAVGRMTQTISVALEGPQSLLDKIGPSDIIVKLDVAKLPRGEHEVAPSIELPEAYRATIRITSIEPETLLIRLR
jgi:YbbR domain-containing protein